MTNYADVYADTRAFLIENVRDLGDADASTTVPGSPEWSVKDTVAHVSGLVADLLNGRKPPLGTPEMTTRQVGERADRTIAEVCDEWAANAEAIRPLLTENELYGLGLTADLTVHCHDIAEAVPSVKSPPIAATLAGCERYAPMLQERVGKRCGVALRVIVGDRTWEPTGDGTASNLAADPTDFLLSVTGRRTRAQVEAGLTFDGDATAILDTALLQYGPYRSA